MTYTKKFLESLNYGSEQQQNVVKDLFQKARNNEELSLTESEYIFLAIHNSHSDKPENKLDSRSFPCCDTPRFLLHYLIYTGNFSGGYPAFDYNGIIPINRKRKDLEELENIHKKWLPNLSKFNHKDQLLNFIASEANKEINELKKLYKKEQWGFNMFKAKLKAISLHSKFIYHKVQLIFEDASNDLLVVPCCEIEITIDKNTIVHIFWRHYADASKQFDTNKSFHQDRNIDYLNLPSEIKNILTEIDGKLKFDQKPDIHIPIKIRGVIYSLWLKQVKEPHKGKGQISFYRLQTFYPVTDKIELSKISGMEEKPISNELCVYSN